MLINYKKDLNVQEATIDELEYNFESFSSKKFALLLLPFVLVVLTTAFVFLNKHSKCQDIGETLSPILSNYAIASENTKQIHIPTGIVNQNPFLPYREIGKKNSYNNVKYDLVAPPEILEEDSEAARIMNTTVSGIMYDKVSPSAILNIEGNDYLVKKGDVINNYKVTSITQNSVTVKLGNNTYNAGIGEILTDGTINYNNISNLNKKFGGR